MRFNSAADGPAGLAGVMAKDGVGRDRSRVAVGVDVGTEAEDRADGSDLAYRRSAGDIDESIWRNAEAHARPHRREPVELRAVAEAHVHLRVGDEPDERGVADRSGAGGAQAGALG